MSNEEPRIVELEQQHAVAMRADVPMAKLPQFFEKAYTAVVAAVEQAGAEIAGPPFGYYPVMPTDGMVSIEAGFPVSEPVAVSGEVHDLVLPGGRAVVAWHIGPYERMEETYDALQAWMARSQLEPASAMWECYLSDPVVEPDPSTWRTKIVWPIETTVGTGERTDR